MSEGNLTSKDPIDDQSGHQDRIDTIYNRTTSSSNILDLLKQVQSGSLDDVVRHKTEGTNMKGKDYDQRTALHIAAAEGREDIVRYLIEECGVSLLPKDRYGRAAYDDATFFKKDKIASYLRDKTIEIHGTKHDPHIEPPRSFDQAAYQCITAASEGDIDSLQRHFANGADLTCCDYDQRTPLHLAAANGHLQVVSYLLKECKGNPTLKDRFDRTAIDEARENNHPEVEKVLLEYTEVSIQKEINNLDPHSIEQYVKALKEGDEIPNTIRINVIGISKAGKTTLTKKLIGLPLENIDPTNGIDVHVHEATTTKDGKWTKQDNDGEESQGIRRIAKISNFLELPKTRNENNNAERTLFSMSDDGKLDLDSNVCSSKKRKISKENKAEIQLFDSIIKGQHTHGGEDHYTKSINVWDFGGQLIFYATHQLFHSPRAIYLLTLDVTRPLADIVNDDDLLRVNEDSSTMNVQSYCKFWLQSIHSFVGTSDGDPPVILVGTHRDLLHGTCEEKDKQAKDYLETVRTLFSGSPTQKHIHEKVFIVDNTIQSDDEFNRLRSFIANLFKEKTSWNQETPAKWIPLENRLMRKKGMKYITLEEVFKLDKENVLPIGDEEEIRAFLMYQHAEGTIVYFNVEGLSHFVILDPQWIIDAFKCIITTSLWCKSDTIQPLRRELISHGILKRELLDEAWRGAGVQDFFEQKEILLQYLHILGIVARARHFDASTNVTEVLDFFIVPSLLQRSENDCWSCFQYENKNTPLAFVFTEDIVSPTLYHHITSALLGKWPVVKEADKPQLFADCGMYQLDEETIGIIRKTENTIEINVGNMSGKPVKNCISDLFKRFVEMILRDSLERFNVKSGQKYTLCLKCDHSLQVQGMHISTPESLMIDVKPLMQWLPNTLELPHSNPQKVTQSQLSLLSKAIGYNWELLGISLGVSNVEIEKIKMEPPFSPNMQIYRMFNIWYQKAGENATWDVLLKKMRDYTQVSVDRDIVRNIMENPKGI